MDWVNVGSKVREWIKNYADFVPLNDDEVKWGFQIMQPVPPYITVTMTSLIKETGKHITNKLDTTFTTSNTYSLTFSIQSFGSESHTHIYNLMDSLESGPARDLLYEADLAYVRMSEGFDISAILETIYEKRFGFDVTFRITTNRDFTLSVIEKAIIGATLNNQGKDIDMQIAVNT